MRLSIRLLIVAVVLGGLGALAIPPLQAYWKTRNAPHFRTSEVSKGTITSVVRSSGTIQPVLRVTIGTFVSGPLKELLVDFNAHVKKDELMARIDPRIYDAAVKRDQAALATAKAEVSRNMALLQQAINNERRSLALRKANRDYISDTEMDQFRFNRMSLEAQLEVAKANVEQAQGSLANSEANLAYTEIRAPVDGIIIDKKVDQGQTLAATFQMPELFVIAPDMDKKMLVFANVDEADIGHIRQAQETKQPVSFKVDAYREEVFTGVVSQVRLNPTTTQNVVTYTVVVEAPNPELKLLPGMTANLEFQVTQHADVLRVPNAALRYFPLPVHVRTEDRKLVEGMAEVRTEVEQRREAGLPAEIDSGPRMKRHVWVKKGELLEAVEVTVGISDSKYSELLAGELTVGTPLATGLQPKT